MTSNLSWIPAGLEPVALRLSRADQATFNLAQLSLEWSRNADRGPIELHQVEHPPGMLNLVVTRIRPIAPEISMLFSEAIHHLRAAIDNAIFYMVEGIHGSLDDGLARRVAMPIYLKANQLNKWFHNNEKADLRALGGSSELSHRIQSLQPFSSEDGVPSISEPLASLMGVEAIKEHPLLLLQGYSNEDKHRSIRVAAARTMIQRDDRPFSTSDRAMHPIEPGDTLSSTPRGVPVVVESNAAVHVQRPDKQTWVSPGHELDQLRTHVASIIIPTLVTGIAIPRAFPPEIDLGDTDQTHRERIEAGSWQSALERMRPITGEALIRALEVEPSAPPTVEAETDTS